VSPRRAARLGYPQHGQRRRASDQRNGQDEELVAWAETLSAGEDPALDAIESASREDVVTLLDRALGLLSDEARRLIEVVYQTERKPPPLRAGDMSESLLLVVCYSPPVGPTEIDACGAEPPPKAPTNG
jgi:hypothetical protein